MKAITKSRTSFDFGNLIICDCNYDQKLNQFVHFIKKAASVSRGRSRYFNSSTVKRLVGGQEEFDADAGVGVHVERPFGVGGKLDGETPVGDGGHLRVALLALRGGVGLHADGTCRHGAVGGEEGLQVRHLGGRDAGQGVGAEFLDDGLHGLFERGLVGIEVVADHVVVHLRGVGAGVFLACGGLHLVEGGQQVGLGGVHGVGGHAFAGGGLRGSGGGLAAGEDVVHQLRDFGGRDFAHGERGGVGGLLGGDADFVGLAQRGELRLVEHGGRMRGCRGCWGCWIVHKYFSFILITNSLENGKPSGCPVSMVKRKRLCRNVGKKKN